MDYQKARAGHGEPGALATGGTSPLSDLDEVPGDEEWKAALAIVHRLGRHTLAVTLVGAYLGSYPDVSYRQFAQDLATHGIGLALDAVGNDDKVKNLIQHPETLVGPLFEHSVARLSPLALRTLEYAAILPPDLVPLAWLKQLVAQDAEMAEALKPKPFQPPPCEETLRTLEGLQFLVGQPYTRMHRVVQEVVRRRMSETELLRLEQAVLRFIKGHTRTPELRDHRHYQILGELGRGAFGVVYVAKNKLTDRLEFLKVLHQELSAPGSTNQND